MINCNIVADHRYVDGGNAKNFCQTVREIFEHPHLFLDSPGPIGPIEKQPQQKEHMKEEVPVEKK
jgi:uncharacterized Zn-finger protein